MINEINPYSIKDLKKVHDIMTFWQLKNLVSLEKVMMVYLMVIKCIFVCPQPEIINELIEKLFSWMNENKEKLHPLIFI